MAEPPRAPVAPAVIPSELAAAAPAVAVVQHHPADENDDSEWEYEYSTTETEVWLVRGRFATLGSRA